MKMLRKISLVAAIIALGLSLAACGGGDEFDDVEEGGECPENVIKLDPNIPDCW